MKAELEQNFMVACQDEKRRMLRNAKFLYATIVMDETWLDGMYLVAIDAASGFILLEKMSEQRTADAWEKELRAENPDLDIVFIQATSDEAAALIHYAKKRIGGNHSPDLFHILHEISKGLSLPLHNELRQATNEVEGLIAEHQEIESILLEHLENIEEVSENHVEAETGGAREELRDKPPEILRCNAEKTGPSLAQEINLACRHLEEVLADLDEASKALSTIAQASQSFSDSLNAISELYHPVSLTTGRPRTPAAVMREIYAVFGKLEECATIFRSEKISKHIKKAKKVGKSMQETLEFANRLVREEVSKRGFSPSQQRQILMRLIPAAYLDRVAMQAKTAEKRRRIQEIAKRCREQALASYALACLSQRELDDILKFSKALSDIFQRSSSCAEGRNGMLAQKFHSSRGFSAHQIEKFTYWANFVARRADQSTAAERFFRIPQRDICRLTHERLNEFPVNRMVG
jgi:hypothetical protein